MQRKTCSSVRICCNFLLRNFKWFDDGLHSRFHSLAARDMGPQPKVFKCIDKNTNMPTNSSVLGLLLSGVWLLYFFGANLTPVPWFGKVSFDSSELPIVTVYAMYIPIFIMMMVKERSLNFFKRFLMPALALCACVFMVIAACYSHCKAVLFYLIIYFVIMAIGIMINSNKK